MKIVLSCGQKKLSVQAPAYLMYQGSYFKAALEWAKTIASPKDVLILSAKYGLIPCRQVIKPYDSRMKTPTQQTTVQQIKAQIAVMACENDWLVFCGGKDYREILQQSHTRVLFLWEHAMLKGNGMGYQIQWFKKNAGIFPITVNQLKKD